MTSGRRHADPGHRRPRAHAELRRLPGARQSDPRQGARHQRRGATQRRLRARRARPALHHARLQQRSRLRRRSAQHRRARSGSARTQRLSGPRVARISTNVDTQRPDYLQEALVPIAQRNPRWRRRRHLGARPGQRRGARQRRAERDLPLPAAGDAGAARRLCEAGNCNAHGVPVELPRPEAFGRRRCGLRSVRTAWPAPGTPPAPAATPAVR